MAPNTAGGRIAEFAADIVLAGLAFAAAAWVLLFDVLCIGSCTNSPDAGLGSWLTIGAAVGGTALLLTRRRATGRAVLVAGLALAVVLTLAG